MSYGKRAEAAFYVVATPHFESARRQRITDPNARTCAIEDLVYQNRQYPYEVANDQHHGGYERPPRPSRPVSLELQEYLSAERRPDDSHTFRELHETLSDSATFVRKRVKRGARALLVHRISIFAALLLGVAVVAVVAPERVHALLHPGAPKSAPPAVVAAAVPAKPAATTESAAPTAAAAAAASAPSVPVVAMKEEPKPTAVVAASSSSFGARPAKHPPTPRGNVLAIRKDRSAAGQEKREDKDSGWTVASPVSTAPSSAAPAPAATTVESDRAKQDLAAVTAALANTL